MATISISKADEDLVQEILAKGLLSEGPKLYVLRLSLALSLRVPTEPDEALDALAPGGPKDKDKDYDLEQVTGRGTKSDHTDAYRCLLSAYHGEDLLAPAHDQRFRTLLQRHIRRGLRDLRLAGGARDLYERILAVLSAVSPSDELPLSRPESALQAAFVQTGIAAEISEIVQGVRLTRYRLQVQKPELLRRRLDKLAFLLGYRQEGAMLTETEEPQQIWLDLPRPRATWRRTTGADLRTWASSAERTPGLRVWPGVDVLGTPYSLDLDAKPHILIAGAKESGVSTCLQALLLSILHSRPRGAIPQFCLIDPRRMIFPSFARLPQLYQGGIIDETEEARRLLRELRNRPSDIKAGRLIIFIAEMGDLPLRSGEMADSLMSLARNGRKAGINLVIATRQPDPETLAAPLRAQMSTRIALGVRSADESRMILEQPGAERLTRPGDMLVRPSDGGPVVRLHGVEIGPDDVALGIKRARS